MVAETRQEGRVSDVTRQPVVEVVRAGPEHAGAMAEFFRATWTPGSTGERVRESRAREARENPASGGEEPPTFLWLSDGKVLGYVSTIPGRLWSNGSEQRVHWMKGLMVLPEHRNGPIGFMVLKEAMKHLGPAFSIAAAYPARRLFTALKFADLGAIPNRLRVLEPGRLFARLDLEALGLGGLPAWLPRAVRTGRRLGLSPVVGTAGKAALAVGRTPVGLAGRRLETGTLAEPPELDQLWKDVRHAFPAAAVRDARYLAWRYDWGAEGGYRLITARDNGRLVGIAVLRRPGEGGDPRLKGIRLAVLSELLADPARADVAQALLRRTDLEARRLGADAILGTMSHPAFLRQTARRGWVRLPGNIHLLQRDPDGTCGLPDDLSGWLVTRGDGDADESL